MLALDTATHGTADAHGCPLFRGELLLSDSELVTINQLLSERGTSLRVEVVRTPPLSPQLAQGSGKTKRPNSSSASQLPRPSLTSIPSTRMPSQKRLRVEELTPKQVVKQHQLCGWRAVVLDVCQKLQSSEQGSENDRETIGYWFGRDVPPEVVDGVREYPVGLETIKARILDGTYSSHFKFQQDLSTLTDFVFRSFGLYSTPFLVATKLRRLANELMVTAVRMIRNEEYFTIPMPTAPAESPSDDEAPPLSTPSSPKITKTLPIQRKKSAAEPTAESKALLERLAALEKQVERVNKNTIYGEGGVKAMSEDELRRLENDLTQLSDRDLQKIIDEKLKGQPGLSYDGVGEERTAVIELAKMQPKLQRNLRRIVTMKLNESKGHISIEKIRKIQKDDKKAKVNEEAVEKLLEERKKIRDRQIQRQQIQQQRMSADASSSGGEGDGNLDRFELARLKDLEERDIKARRVLELMALDGDDDSLD